jgi:hypothetical protein
MAEDEILHMHHYRIEFSLHDKPVEKRLLELMRKMEIVKREVKKQFHDQRGLQQLSCAAPYVNYAVCYASTLGEQEWLPEFVEKLAHDKKIVKEEPDIKNIWVRKTFVPPFVPTRTKYRAEKDWYDSIQKIRGSTEIMTKEAEERQRGEVEKKSSTQKKLGVDFDKAK